MARPKISVFNALVKLASSCKYIQIVENVNINSGKATHEMKLTSVRSSEWENVERVTKPHEM